MTTGDLRNAAALLTGTNVACAAIGVSQGVLVLRWLGTETYGAAAVVVAVTAVATNIVDVRLTDLISKLYFDDRASGGDGSAYRAAALRLGLGLYAAGAALILGVSILLVALGARWFTDHTITLWWACLAALSQAVSYSGTFFVFVQRFVMTPARMAGLQLASASINAATMVVAVALTPTLGGYLIGLLVSASAIAAFNAIYALEALGRNGIVLFGARRPRAAAIAIDRHVVWRFVMAGNLLGYVKLLHRAADVLLVAAFCGDRDTGVYKLARSIADVMHAMSEAIGRVYQPRLYQMLQAGAHAEYAGAIRSLTTTAAALTVLAIAVELVTLPRIAGFLGVTDAQGLTASTAILTASFFFVGGLQIWIWPVFVSLGRLNRCMVYSAVAVLAGQYTIGPALVYLTGQSSPVWFSVGYLSFYVVSTLSLNRELRRDYPSIASRPRELAPL